MKKVLLMLMTGFAFSVQAADKPSICMTLKASVRQGPAPQKLARFFAAQWKYIMTEFPENATFSGYPGQNDRWTDLSLEAIGRRKKEDVCQLEILNTIPSADLSSEDKINYALAQRKMELRIEGNKFPSENLQINQLDGMQIDLPDTLLEMPSANKQDYENILARLDKVPELERQTEVLLRDGLAKHVTPVKMFLAKVPAQFDKVLTSRIEDSPLFKPFAEMNSTISPEDKASLQDKARAVIKSKVYPALQKLRDFVVAEYIPGARESIALSDMPNGKEWYAYSVKWHTTTNMTPDELHTLGLKEVARITREMEKVQEQVKFKGDRKAFNQFLLSDKRFYYTDANQLLLGFRDIAKRIDPELTKEFKTLPRLTYGVREMPAYKAAAAPAAYYEPGSLTAGRPGYFEANTSDLPGRPKWGMEALTLHEAVPGHHLQFSIAQELKDLPEFRKHGRYTAYEEGWGLYAESLGDELGLYKDPYSKYGQLSYEMWRAIRLVVDTGIHAKGWTRQQALDYFTSNMPKSPAETGNEVDRYITWPGQALAYKVGELKFKELRSKAEAELGPKFNIREFHDELLRHGSLPMDVLDKTVTDWISRQKRTPVQTTSI